MIERLLPAGWQEAARERGAFQRARYTTDPASLLRLLLFHAVNHGGLRETVAQARASGIAQMSAVALYKRLRSAGAGLAWLGAELARALREQPRLSPECARGRLTAPRYRGRPLRARNGASTTRWSWSI